MIVDVVYVLLCSLFFYLSWMKVFFALILIGVLSLIVRVKQKAAYSIRTKADVFERRKRVAVIGGLIFFFFSFFASWPLTCCTGGIAGCGAAWTLRESGKRRTCV